METILNFLKEYQLLAPLMALTVSAIVFATKWFKVKSNEIAKRTENETIVTYTNILTDKVATIVTSLTQTIGDEFKKAHVDGKLSIEEMEFLKDKAISETKRIITNDAKEVLGVVFADLDKLIAHTIEETVKKSK